MDDIHNIRIETSKKLDKMSNEEILYYFNDAEKKILKLAETNLQ